MQLRIVDNRNTNGKVEIVLEREETIENYQLEFYESCTPTHIKQLMSWYFTSYHEDLDVKDDQAAINKLLKVGQDLGDMIHGENFELNRFMDVFEETGFQDLKVSIESDNLTFFSERWESLVLPLNKYVLSTAVNSFTRVFTHLHSNNSEIKKLNLQTTSPSSQAVSQLLPEANDEENRPLGLIQVISSLQTTASNTLDLAYSTLQTQGAIAYNLLVAPTWKTTEQTLGCNQTTHHIFHYKGPVYIDNDNVFLSFGPTNNPEKINLKTVCQTLNKADITVLTIDSEGYSNQGESQNACDGLAKIAELAMSEGISNIIGLADITDQWTSSYCFETLFNKLPLGLSLGQSVVELRKAAQIELESQTFSASGKVFQRWPLPIHYSNQDVIFFNSPQQVIDKSSQEVAGNLRNQLFGFLGEMMPPLISSVADTNAFKVLEYVQQGKAVFISGGEGSGKTHTVHQVSSLLWLTKQIDYGFYFDFKNDFYTPDIMLEMIAPAFELTPNEHDASRAKLHSNTCCFVLDNIAIKKDQNDSLFRFLQELVDNGHKVLLAGSAVSFDDALPHATIHIAPFTKTEQQRLVARRISESAVPLDNLADDKLNALLLALDGNPWLIQNSLVLLRNENADELIKAVKDRVKTGSHEPIIDSFYEWRWSQMPAISQKLLLVCHSVDGLLLELLMIVCDGSVASDSANEFFNALGEDASYKVSDGIKLWENSGFLKTFSHGHVIDRRSFSFLREKAQRKEYQQKLFSENLTLALSKLICKGVEILTHHVIKQPNPAISHNLLVNRRVWVEHVERLWFAGFYKDFISARNSLEQLLKQVKLSSEMAMWSIDLLDRSPDFVLNGKTVSEQQLSWLVLAISGLSSDSALESQKITSAVDVLHTWIAASEANIERELMPLFMQSVTFLERYYQKKKDYAACIEVCKVTCVVYRQYQIWKKLTQSFKALAQYSFELGKNQDCLKFESNVLEDIPYDEAPEGYFAQQMLEILVSRVARKDTQNAKSLMTKMRELDDSPNISEILDNIQADIDFEDGNFLLALPQYYKKWHQAVEMDQHKNLEQLKNRLRDIKRNISDSEFDQIAQNSGSPDALALLNN